jgi:hypothetical protein
MASQLKPIELICPECRSRNSISLCERVDAEDAERVGQILDGALFDFRCRGCGSAIPGDHSIDFIDRHQKLFVRYQAPGDLGPAAGWTAALGERDSPEEYLLIRAGGQADFIELVHVWDAGLDLGGMLILKHQLASQITHDAELEAAPLVCSFDRIDDTGNLQYILILKENSRPETVTLPPDVLGGVLRRFQTDIPVLFARGKWVDWNAETVRQLWQRHVQER